MFPGGSYSPKLRGDQQLSRLLEEAIVESNCERQMTGRRKRTRMFAEIFLLHFDRLTKEERGSSLIKILCTGAVAELLGRNLSRDSTFQFRL